MQSIRILCPGKLGESFWRDAAAEYVKRLARFCRLQIEELPESRLPAEPSRAQIEAALHAEGAELLRRLRSGEALVALCAEGEPIQSEGLGARLARFAANGRPVAFTIGSSHGLAEEVKSAAALRLSMSAMTFPHQLCRVMLLEQIYRAFQINAGGAYHK